MTDAIDIWTCAAMAAFPLWIFAVFAVLGKLVRCIGDGIEWWRLPLYMALFIPLALIGAVVPAGMLMRQIDRSIVYEQCVKHESARDPLNGCPDWTRKLLARKDRQND